VNVEHVLRRRLPVREPLTGSDPLPVPLAAKPHILKSVDRELSRLTRDVISAGELAADHVEALALAMLQSDTRPLKEAAARRVRLHELEQRIDRQAFQFIALFTPVAADLSAVRVLLRLGSDIARITAETDRVGAIIPRLLHASVQGAKTKVTQHLRRFTLTTAECMRHAVSSFADRDVEQARDLLRRGNEIVVEAESTVRRLLTYGFEGDDECRLAFEALPVVNGLERIANGAQRIADLALPIGR
jgi:phosphate uptake regulator